MIRLDEEDLTRKVYSFYTDNLTNLNLIFKKIPFLSIFLVFLLNLCAFSFVFMLLHFNIWMLFFFIVLLVLFFTLLKFYDQKIITILKNDLEIDVYFHNIRSFLSPKSNAANLLYLYKIKQLEQKLIELGFTTTEQLDYLAQIFSNQADKERTNKIIFFSICAVLTLPLWSEFVSWAYGNNPFSKIMTIAIGLFCFAILLAFLIKTFIFEIWFEFILFSTNRKNDLTNMIQHISLKYLIKNSQEN